ncbi:MAG: hypothetical protein JWN68_2675 [Nocardioides sp.]|jgi:hypothetical protein|uniref:hypothetical protein n=1 Tax=Nocardioides sp. TaxID=35761 RepID=UPI0026226729|nr:hypothetical protein [Nocardioides sp.]MCW2834722.1 hypothetical protein [Nocardioides sp.]
MSATLARPTRRTLVRSAAWTVPVVAIGAAAPAFALTCTGAAEGFSLNWTSNTYTVDKSLPVHVGKGIATGPTGSQSIEVTFRSSVFGTTTRAGDSMTVVAQDNLGGLGIGRGLQLRHINFNGGFGNREVVQISFARAITGLSFTLTDIDSVDNGFYDRITLDGTRNFTVTPRNSTSNYVRGNGLDVPETNNAVGPWRQRNDDSSLDLDSNRGNVTVTYPGTIAKDTPITLNYWSSNAGTNQQVFFSNLTFMSASC